MIGQLLPVAAGTQGVQLVRKRKSGNREREGDRSKERWGDGEKSRAKRERKEVNKRREEKKNRGMGIDKIRRKPEGRE